MLISVAGTGKNQLQPGQESMGDAPVLSYCSWLRNSRPKATCVLEHCREGELEPWHVTVPHNLTRPEVNKNKTGNVRIS